MTHSYHISIGITRHPDCLTCLAADILARRAAVKDAPIVKPQPLNSKGKPRQYGVPARRYSEKWNIGGFPGRRQRVDVWHGTRRDARRRTKKSKSGVLSC